jgi:DNA polymerase-3 subunit alpha
VAEASEMKRSTGKGEELLFAGVISGLKVQKSKKGDMYARGYLQDMTGSVEMFVFPEAYKRLSEKVKLEVPVLVRAGVRVDEGSSAQLAISDITPLEDAKPKLPKALRLRIPLESATEDTIDELHSVFISCKGEAKVLFDLEAPGEFVAVMEADGYNVLPDRVFLRRVEELCGRGSIKVID